MTLAARFSALKKQVGGNREFHNCEFSCGQPRENELSITMPNAYNKRLISELDFAISLSQELDGRYNELIGSVLSVLELSMQEDGALTKATCENAEKQMLPMKRDAKEYSLILAGHAHIDMNWLWSWHETVAVTLATFKTVLGLMDIYPDFCFSQSQASVYKIVEDFEPELMDRIRERIKEGRWEVTASAWVETDKNMPDTETLLRHIKCTKEYMRDSWGVNPDELEIDFLPDSFGHSALVPEIDFAGNVKYLYHCRGRDADETLYRWRSPSGKELLCCCEPRWYNSSVNPTIGTGIFEMLKRSSGLKTALIVYGVGDHGGGPTRNDIENALEMAEWPIFPSIRFGTFREYFALAEKIRDDLPVVSGEFNVIFTGCYTTQSRIKQANRRCERALLNSEALSAFASLNTEAKCSADAFTGAWRELLFTDFHDILTGSCVQPAREYAMGILSDAYAVANTRHTVALSALSGVIDNSAVNVPEEAANYSQGAGAGYNLSDFSGVPITEKGSGKTRIFNIFNPVGVDKNEVVEITVWDWQGDLRLLKVTDVDGKLIEFCTGNENGNYWSHKFFKLYVYVSLSAFGYASVVIGESEFESYPHYLEGVCRHDSEYAEMVLENENIRAEFDRVSGRLISYKDSSGNEYIKQGQSGGFNFVITQNDGMSSWRIGRYLNVTPLSSPYRISRVHKDALRSYFSVEYRFGDSKLSTEICLDKGGKGIRISSDLFWYEKGEQTIPVLTYSVPLNTVPDKYIYDIPGGTIERVPQSMDVPALKFAAAEFECGNALSIVTDCKYGFRGTAEGVLSSTLINGANDPDPLPETGNHTFTLFVCAESAEPKALVENAVSLNAKAVYTPASSHSGALPPCGSFLKFNSECAVLSSVTLSDDNESLLVRMFNTACRDGKATLIFNSEVASAQTVDVFGDVIEGTAEVDDATVTAEFAPCSIVTLKVKLLQTKA